MHTCLRTLACTRAHVQSTCLRMCAWSYYGSPATILAQAVSPARLDQVTRLKALRLPCSAPRASLHPKSPHPLKVASQFLLHTLRRYPPKCLRSVLAHVPLYPALMLLFSVPVPLPSWVTPTMLLLYPHKQCFPKKDPQYPCHPNSRYQTLKTQTLAQDPW